MQQSKEVSSGASILDVRGMTAPDNILAILKKAGETGGAPLEFRIDSNPFQLYDLLQQRGYVLEMQSQSDGTFLGKAVKRDAKDH